MVFSHGGSNVLVIITANALMDTVYGNYVIIMGCTLRLVDCKQIMRNDNFPLKKMMFFLFCVQNITCGYTLELPWQGSSNKYPEPMFLITNKKNVYPCIP